jgi:hypothetical protein
MWPTAKKVVLKYWFDMTRLCFDFWKLIIMKDGKNMYIQVYKYI